MSLSSHRSTSAPSRARRGLALSIAAIVGTSGALVSLSGGGAAAATSATTSLATAAAAATPRAAAIKLAPVADTTVYDPNDYLGGPGALPAQSTVAGQPTLDVSGQTNGFCANISRSYALLKFDLSNVPADADLTGARLRLTSLDGYAYDGSLNHFLIPLSDPTFDTSTVSWGSPAAGVRTPDSSQSDSDLYNDPSLTVGNDNAFRFCDSTVREREFPRNGWAISGDSPYFTDSNPGQPTRDRSEQNFLAAVRAALARGDHQLALEVYNPSVLVPGKGGLYGYSSRYASSEAADPAQRPQLTLSFATADVTSAVPAGDSSNPLLHVTGGITGEANTAYRLEVSGSQACTSAGISRQVTPLGRITVTTDANGIGFVSGDLPMPSTPPKFVTAAGTSPDNSELTTASGCTAVGADNDVWTRALTMPLTGSTQLTGTVNGYLDRSGQSRWYKLPVQPGGNVSVNLSGLPADYDVAMFSDIGKAYTQLTSLADLTKLSAEYAPSVFSPSVFSPSVFSPSVFSPDAFAPSVFSPSVFSPSVFSPSVFSPSVFSPSVFSPSVFSPSVFSPSVFSPSVFSPSVFSPNPDLPPDLTAEAFAGAQSRSIVAVSATAGTIDESTTADTWNNDGYFYVRVTGRNGAAVPYSPFTLTVTRNDIPACAGVSPVAGTESAPTGSPVTRTLVLRDTSRQLAGTSTEQSDLNTTLSAFLGRSEVAGVVADLASSQRVQALRTQANAHPGCPYAVNLVAAATKDVVAAYRAENPNLRWIVVLGPDGSVPFFRYPDQGLLGPESDYSPPVNDSSASNASLRLNYVLGQDEYGASTTLSLGADKVPVPDLAVGRLVETASEASGILKGYLQTTNGSVTPSSALVTGYDFLADAADSVASDLTAGVGSSSSVEQLITANGISPQDSRSWNASALASALFTRRHDITFLAGHFSANSALAADFSTSVYSADLGTSTVDMTNAIVFSAGCHSGYNIDDVDAIPNVTAPLDWAQAFARKGATLIAGTGYQYGDTDFLEYSERIYADFAKELRYGTGPVSVGDALVAAKKTYLAQTPDSRGLHRKALIESTLFGLPMLSVNLPSGRLPAPSTSSVVSSTNGYAANPGSTLGLRYADLGLNPTLTSHQVTLTGIDTNNVTATYLSGDSGVVTNPAEPAVPLVSRDVSVQGMVLRGVGFRGGDYSDSSVVPLTGAATTEIRGVHTAFTSPVFYPMRLATPNYTDALDGAGTTRLLVTPTQHRSIPGGPTSTQRRYNSLGLRLFYSATTGRPAQSQAPSVSGVTATVDGNDILLGADAITDPAAGIQQVWVTWTGAGSSWTSVDLTQCNASATGAVPADCPGEQSTHWVGRIVGGAANASAIRFVAQAVSGVGLVGLNDNVGSYFSVTPATPPAPPAATTLALSGVPAHVTYGSSSSITATLTSGGSPVAGRALTISLGGSTRSTVTGSDGTATVSMPVTTVPGDAEVRAGFAGDTAYAASDVTTSVVIDKVATALALTTSSASADGPVDVTAKLTAAGAPLQFRSVWLKLPDGSVKGVATDYLGQAVFRGLVLPHGTPTLQAAFLSALGPVPAQPDDIYLGSTASTSLDVASVVVTGPSSVAGGQPYAATAKLDATVAHDPTYALVGAPSWLSINATTGAISGTTPVTSGTTFTYRVSATFGGSTATSPLVTVSIAAPADLALAITTLPKLKTRSQGGYGFTVTNRSSFASWRAPTVTVALPTGLTYASYGGTGWTCTASGQTVTCNRSTALAGGSSSSLVVVVNVTGKDGTMVTVSAAVTPDDRVPTNNKVSVTQKIVGS